MGGWAKRTLNVTPRGKVLPCHAAETIPNLEFWIVTDHSLADIWYNSPAFNAYRGTDWMPEPCRSCERKEMDYGGCRCQALALTGDARNADPICHRAPITTKWQRSPPLSTAPRPKSRPMFTGATSRRQRSNSANTPSRALSSGVVLVATPVFYFARNSLT